MRKNRPYSYPGSGIETSLSLQDEHPLVALACIESRLSDASVELMRMAVEMHEISATFRAS
jgi:hypothetical protein